MGSTKIKAELTDESILIMVRRNDESYLYTVMDFFKREDMKDDETYWLIQLDGCPAERLTKLMLASEFPYFEDTKQYKAIWNRFNEILRRKPTTVEQWKRHAAKGGN